MTQYRTFPSEREECASDLNLEFFQRIGGKE